MNLPEIDLHVPENALGRLLVPMIHICILSIQSEPLEKQLSLLGFQELRRLRPVRNDPEGERCHDDGCKTFEDEDPSPARVACNAVHMGDGVREEATEGACDDGGGEEEIKAPLKFVALVKHGDQIQTAGEESGFQPADDDTAHHQACERLCDSLADGDDAPGEHDGGDEDGGPQFLEDHIARHFEDDIEDEEGAERNVIVLAVHVEVFFQALDARIADVDAGRRARTRSVRGHRKERNIFCSS